MTSTTSGSVSPSSGGSVNARKVKLEIPAVKKPNLEEYKSQIDAGQKGVDELHKKLVGHLLLPIAICCFLLLPSPYLHICTIGIV